MFYSDLSPPEPDASQSLIEEFEKDKVGSKRLSECVTFRSVFAFPVDIEGI